jgi:fatty-acyl-CoA synthase
MLRTGNRSEYRTLLDAVVLNGMDEAAEAIIYVASDAKPRTVSHSDFRQSVLHYAGALNKLGVRGRDLVVIANTQSLESIFAFWGTMIVGAIPSMFPALTEKLDPEIYMGSMAELVALSEVRLVLTTNDLAPELDSRVGCPVYSSSSLEERVGKVGRKITIPLKNGPTSPDEIAFLQHSSGTTGLQKGVALSHTAVLNQLASYSDAINLDEADVIVSWLPLYHDMGLIAGFLLPLVQGIPLVLMSPFDWVRNPALLLSAISRFQGTLTWLPNFAYNHMARRIRDRDLDGLSLSSMRMFINCSEPVRKDSHDLFLNRFRRLGVRKNQLAVSYAMAENTFAVTQTEVGQEAGIDFVNKKALEEDRYGRARAGGRWRDPAGASCG